MSTESRVRHASWLVFVTSVLLISLSPSSATAGGPYPAPDGIVISIPLPNAEPSSSSTAFSKIRVHPKAHPKSLSKIEYASLPSNNQVNDSSVTGSLPNTSTLGAKSLSSFTSLVSQGTITLRDTTPTNCLPGNLLQVVADVAGKFGPISLESTHRTASRNWRAGGARHSLHLSCRAIDFRVRTRTRGVMAYLSARPEVGGLKIYRNGIIHIDNGSRRSW